MKVKFLIPILGSIILGIIIGRIFFNEYDKNTLSVFKEMQNIYFVQLGVYNNLEILKEKVKDYKDYLILLEEDGYHIYVGISKDKKVAERIAGYFKNSGKDTYIKEKKVDNTRFLNILSEYDKITTIVTSEKDLMDIERIVLSNYEELVLESGFND